MPEMRVARECHVHEAWSKNTGRSGVPKARLRALAKPDRALPQLKGCGSTSDGLLHASLT